MTLRQAVTLAMMLVLPALSACNGEPVCPYCENPEPAVAASGLATLNPYTSDADFAKAHLSIKFATTVDDPAVLNNWDVVYNRGDTFRVNTVTDDTSWIVDLGAIPMEHIPETVDLTLYGTGVFGAHDEVPAFVDHVYLVRNVDTSTRQYAAFRVAGYVKDTSVTLQWFRSSDPEKFVFKAGVQK